VPVGHDHVLPDAGRRGLSGVGEVRIEEVSAHRLVVDHVLGVDREVRIRFTLRAVRLGCPPHRHLLPDALQLGRGNQRLGELVADERVRAGRLAGAGQRDHHRGRPDAAGDVPGIVSGTSAHARLSPSPLCGWG
jgi:hypothetical protein